MSSPNLVPGGYQQAVFAAIDKPGPDLRITAVAGSGKSTTLIELTLLQVAKPGDMVLCRTTVPLVKPAFELIGQGTPATARGRDLGAHLIQGLEVIERVEGFAFGRFHSCGARWAEEQIRRLSLKPDTDLPIASLEDRVASLAAVYVWAAGRGARTTGELRAAIETLFTEEDGKPVILSSIHSSVFRLRPPWGAAAPAS
jgi:DNA helicase-2/ATP-dependent DNA helicase PcrA